jgi:hypothetical protein
MEGEAILKEKKTKRRKEKNIQILSEDSFAFLQILQLCLLEFCLFPVRFYIISSEGQLLLLAPLH